MTPRERGRFRKGRAKTGGRRRGTPNRATQTWKQFMTALVNDPDQEEALRDAIKAHPELLFKAAEHAVGKPRQAVEIAQDGDLKVTYCWQDTERDTERETEGSRE